MPMINMKSQPEKEEAPGGIERDVPQYPRGLRIYLEDDQLQKLGITALPAVGTAMHLMAEAVVESTSAYETQVAGKNMSLCIQITDLEMMASDKAKTPEHQATMLYGGGE